MRAITPGKPTTLIAVFLGQVLGTIKGGAIGLEGFTLLLCLLTTHFDRVDTGKGYTLLHNFGVCTGLLRYQSGGSRASVGSHHERAPSGPWGRLGRVRCVVCWLFLAMTHTYVVIHLVYEWITLLSGCMRCFVGFLLLAEKPYAVKI